MIGQGLNFVHAHSRASQLIAAAAYRSDLERARVIAVVVYRRLSRAISARADRRSGKLSDQDSHRHVRARQLRHAAMRLDCVVATAAAERENAIRAAAATALQARVFHAALAHTTSFRTVSTRGYFVVPYLILNNVPNGTPVSSHTAGSSEIGVSQSLA